METEISIEIHHFTRFLVYGFLRESQILWKTQANKALFNIPIPVAHFILLYYDSNEIQNIYSNKTNQSIEQYANASKISLIPYYLHPFRLIINSPTNTLPIITSVSNIKCRNPDGNTTISFYPKSTYFLLKTKLFHYRIKYENIERVLVCEHPDRKVLLILQLCCMIISGTNKFETTNDLIFECNASDMCSTKISLTKQQLEGEYTKNGTQILTSEMNGPTYDVLARIFLVMTEKRIIATRTYRSANNNKSFECSYKQNRGLLYPLNRSILFVWKSVKYIKIRDIKKIEIMIKKSSKVFDILLYLQSTNQTLLFDGVQLPELVNLMQYLRTQTSITEVILKENE